MAQTASAPIFHRFLGMGATALAGMMVFLRTKAAPPTPDGQFNDVMAYGFASISLVLVVVAVLVLARRVPERQLSQRVEDYWMMPAVLLPVNRVWFVSEGAAILATVGYFLTGHLAPAAMMVMAIGVFWWLGPKTFAKA
jgi:hypothetical protein